MNNVNFDIFLFITRTDIVNIVNFDIIFVSLREQRNKVKRV